MSLSFVINNFSGTPKIDLLLRRILSYGLVGESLEIIIIEKIKNSSLDLIVEKYRKFIQNKTLKIIYTSNDLEHYELLSKGIQYATKEYVGFFSVEDNFNKKFLSNLIDTARVVKVNVIEFNTNYSYNNNKLFQSSINFKGADSNVVDDLTISKFDENPFTFIKKLDTSIWNKIYNTNSLRKTINNLMFNDYFDYFNFLIYFTSIKDYYYLEVKEPPILKRTLSPDQLIKNLYQWTFVYNYFKAYFPIKLFEKDLEFIYLKYLSNTLYNQIKSFGDSIDKEWFYREINKITKEVFPNIRKNDLINENKILKKSFIYKKVIKFND